MPIQFSIELPHIGDEIEVSSSHFGLNFVADFERIGDRSWENFDDIASATGATNIRYPGGITAEKWFDITDPDASEIYLTDGSTRHITGAYEFGEFCAANGYTASYIIPTAKFLVLDPDSGMEVFDELVAGYIKEFVYQTLIATQGNISSFEIGNEYESHMTSQEYGRIVEDIAPLIQEAINAYTTDFGALTSEAKISMQVWTSLANEDTIMTLNDLVNRANGVMSQISESTQGLIDEVVTHWYLKDHYRTYQETYFDIEKDIMASLAVLDQTINRLGDDVDVLLSEYNVNQLESQFFGVAQIPILLKMFAEFVQGGVDSMDFWAAQFHSTAFSSEKDGSLNVVGTVYSYLSSTIDGMAPIDIAMDTADFGAVYFAGEFSSVMAISNLTENQSQLDAMLDAGGQNTIIARIGYLEVDTADADGKYKNYIDLPIYSEPDLSASIEWIDLNISAEDLATLDFSAYQTIFIEFVETNNGDDIYFASLEAEIFQGGVGIDSVSYELVREGIYASLLDGFSSGDFQDFYFDIEDLSGSNFDDTLIGDMGNNTLEGGAGDDVLEGRGGDDIILTGSGNDHVIGGSGDDTIILQGTSGRIEGSAGDDVFITSGGNYNIYGGNGNDVLNLEASEESAFISLSEGRVDFEQSGDEILFKSIETIYGTNNADTLEMKGGSASVYLGGGNDQVFIGNEATGFVNAGNGDDTIFIYDGAVSVNLDDNVPSGDHAEGDVISSGVEGMIGSSFDDVLIGEDVSGDGVLNPYSMLIYGGAGNDTIEGPGGNDWLYGEDGDDILSGGAGGDLINGGAGNDTVDYSTSLAAIFIDLAHEAANGGDAEGDVLIEIENIVGSSFNDTMVGENTHNKLHGGDGSDTLDGGAGTDRLWGGQGADMFVFSPRGGLDVVYDFQDSIDRILVEDFTADEISILAYGESDTEIRGSDGTRMVLRGVDPNQIDSMDFAEVTLPIRGTGTDDILNGSTSDDEIYGLAGSDRLFGDAGNDTLDGGAGTDRLWGGQGADMFVFTPSGGLDVIYDFQDGVDRIFVEDFTADEISILAYGESDAEIRGSDGTRMVLRGIDPNQIDSMDILHSSDTLSF